MAIQSKYKNEQLDELLKDLFIVLEKHKAPADLSLMALGNMVTNILHNSAKDQAQRERLAEAFATTLKNALKSAN
ncbi:DUF1414 domain-containing protein [Actinobacillus minor]|uniref:DUF1414 domain-containing protein n=1 Tax=Actinobacillus minor TaxID=51047 RepID=UPI0023F0158B|nr:DUF1414 domain-containing protein [Actinobacillus minor]MDD6909740.1 DUF1414 domain-containing protein [Actinobacillus minor]MDY4713498.1 DUF1414 domain-containing protein [Actinobacillus minor]MDY5106748.1 DUF1414 domain-containing protein [Actinobacillus minor]